MQELLCMAPLDIKKDEHSVFKEVVSIIRKNSFDSGIELSGNHSEDYLIRERTWSLNSIRKVQVPLKQSSIVVRKYLEPSWFGVLSEPHITIWMR